MDREQAKMELMQIYGSLSSEKQIAIDTLLEDKEPSRKGHWIDECTCSECLFTHEDNEGHILIASNFRFCPNCGAGMRGDAK